MVKRTLTVLLAVLLCGTVPACKKKKPVDRTAAIKEEKKRNAIKNYQELIKKYPQSEYAEKAKERLKVLGPAPTPAKKK